MIHALLLVIGVSSGPALIPSEGPFSRLYLQDVVNGGWIWTVQGNLAEHLFNSSSGQRAIAVSDTIRTTGGYPNETGQEISLSGTLIQQLPENGIEYNAQLADGASDGTYNYSIDWIHDRVLRFDRNWTNPQFMFQLPLNPNFHHFGITWDPTNDSFWIGNGDDEQHYVYNFSRSGHLLSSFVVSAGSQAGFDPLTWIARDPVDGTLWIGRQTFLGLIHNYKTTGEYLGTAEFPALHNSNTLGGEFQIIPGPGGLALLLIIIVRRRPRSRIGS